MKRTKKIIATWILATGLLVSTNGVNASFTSTMSSTASQMQNQAGQMQEQWEKMQEQTEHKVKEIRNQAKEMRKEGIQKIKEERKEFVKETKTNIKTNIKDFRDSYKEQMKDAFKKISPEVKKALKQTRDELKTEAKDLIAKMKNKSLSFAEKVQAREELEKLREQKFEQIKKDLANNPQALKLVEIREAVFQKNKELRDSISEKRKEFRAQRSAMIEKYKELIIKKVWDKIDRMSEAKLKKLNERLAKVYKKVEDNKRLSETHKTRLLSILEWLQDTINDKLSMLNTSDSDTNDILNEVVGQ